MFPLIGTSSIQLESLGVVGLTYAPASRDSTHPGVQAVYYVSSGELILRFGDAHPRDAVPIHRGVLFSIHAVDSLGFMGYWNDGANRTARSEGYFCARRVTQ
jgi:hypothetical protein